MLLRGLFFIIGAIGVLIAMCYAADIRDTMVETYGYTFEANKHIIEATNAVCVPLWLFSGVCMALGILLPIFFKASHK